MFGLNLVKPCDWIAFLHTTLQVSGPIYFISALQRDDLIYHKLETTPSGIIRQCVQIEFDALLEILFGIGIFRYSANWHVISVEHNHCD